MGISGLKTRRTIEYRDAVKFSKTQESHKSIGGHPNPNHDYITNFMIMGMIMARMLVRRRMRRRLLIRMAMLTMMMLELITMNDEDNDTFLLEKKFTFCHLQTFQNVL